MGFDLDRLLDEYDRGGLSRRQLAKGMSRIAAAVRKAFPEIKIPDANRTDQMNIYDPDGLRVQLMQMSHDGYIASESVPDGRGGKKNVQKYKPGEHI